MSFLPSRLPHHPGPDGGLPEPLAIAVCEPAASAPLACAALSPAQLREQIAAIRAATPAPFNVNFFQPHRAAARRRRLALARATGALLRRDRRRAVGGRQRPGRAPFDEAMCAVVEETRPPVVSFHFGLPEAGLLQRVRATGAMILSSATTVEEARWLEARGVDAIIAQGNEAGGHRGMFLTGDIHAQPGLFALLPQIVDAVRVPVIAAGAIADGRGVAAAFALGASAAQIGTAYLLTPQAGRSALHRAAVRAGRRHHAPDQSLHRPARARPLLTRFMREQAR